MRYPIVPAVAFFLLLLPCLMSAPAAAAPHPPCSCEFCLTDLGAKCTTPGGGVLSCRTLIRSGACLGFPVVAPVMTVDAPCDAPPAVPATPELDALPAELAAPGSAEPPAPALESP